MRRRKQPAPVAERRVDIVIDGQPLTVTNRPKPTQNIADFYDDGRDLIVLDATPREQR